LDESEWNASIIANGALAAPRIKDEFSSNGIPKIEIILLFWLNFSFEIIIISRKIWENGEIKIENNELLND
jgi:hypothetical protein|tara:strand:+ start:291 stop:503 length:213 start_codon:yes stop_codon:yes gene_type:complete